MAVHDISALESGASSVERVPLSRRDAILTSIDRALGHLVEIPAALLVVAEVIILFIGVVARYGFHRPLIWSDELSSILFLWLAMLGSAVAFRRGEHMRMTALVASVGPRMWAFLDVVGTCAALAFLLMIVAPSFEYAYEESYITTPALQIANSFRAAALPVGISLMIVFALLRLLRYGQVRTVLTALGTVVAIIGLFWLAEPLCGPSAIST
jgi:TRAP-type C4-dicarboxylate transport system permease small subunit